MMMPAYGLPVHDDASVWFNTSGQSEHGHGILNCPKVPKDESVPEQDEHGTSRLDHPEFVGWFEVETPTQLESR